MPKYDPPNVPLPHNTWFLGLTPVHTPIGTSIDSSVFAKLMVVANRQTDRPRYVGNKKTIDRIYTQRISDDAT